jgi:hypothetical protein
MRSYIKFWSENLKGSSHSEDLGVDGKIILESILEKWLSLGITRPGREADHSLPSSVEVKKCV